MASDVSSKLKELSNARKGPLYVMRQTMRNVAHWKKLQAEVERTAVASSSLLPLMDDLTKKVTEGNQQKIREALSELPTYKKSLREGATAALESALLKWSQKMMKQAEGVGALEEAVAQALTVKVQLGTPH